MKSSITVPQSRARRRGVVAVYVALTLLLMLGAASLAVDAGFMYTRRAQAQKAADAAALAGAYQLSFIGGTQPAGQLRANDSADEYAKYNSYDVKDANTKVIKTYPVGSNTTWFKVDVQRTEPLFFSRALGFKSSNIGATAIAYFITPSVDIPIPTDLYGKNIVTGTTSLPFNFSIYGPEGLHSYGDNISTARLDNGDANPEYNAVDNSKADAIGGYNFIIKNGTMSNGKMQVELYDPDCYNANDSLTGDDYADDANVDELHGSKWLANGEDRRTITQYSLFADNGTPDDFTDDVLIARYTSNNSNTYDMQWMTPPGFSFNKSTYAVAGKTVNYRMNVSTISGSSENAFTLRAGPPHTISGGAASDTAFNSSNGTSAAVRGIIPINFNQDGAAAFPLGIVPSSARGGTLTVTKFDTDVPAGAPGSVNTVYYTCSADDDVTHYPGNIDMTSDAVTTDTISLPANYPGGLWTAHYTAGWGDTSTWRIAASGATPGSISLVR